MPTTFGTASLVYTHIVIDKSQPADELGHFPRIQTITALPGCRHRPLTFNEVIELGYEVGTEMWKSTVPIGVYDQSNSPALTALYAMRQGESFIVAGRKYEIVVAARPHDDLAGRPFKATIVSKRQIS